MNPKPLRTTIAVTLGSAAIGAALFAAATAASGQAQPALAPSQISGAQLAALQSRVIQLQDRVAALEARFSVQGRSMQVGSADVHRLELRNDRASILLDREEVTIRAEKFNILSEQVTINGSRAITLRGGDVLIEGRTINSKAAQDTTLRGNQIRNN